MAIQPHDLDIIKEIGKGTYGTVHLAINKRDKKQVVIKKISLAHSDEKEQNASKQEIIILASLKHPNIVTYKGSYEIDDTLHLIMCYCEGGDLYTAIRENKGALFPEQVIIRWLIQLLMALQYIHARNILHRDLKTQNIFLTKLGLIKLGDFGVAHKLCASQAFAKTMIGTPYYMSPEIFAGKPYNYKSDMWSLGCCLHEMATHQPAFDAQNMSALIYKISKGNQGCLPSEYSKHFGNIVSSLLEKDMNKRPSADSLMDSKYIQENIASFVEDTTRLERKRRSSLSLKKQMSNKDLKNLNQNEEDSCENVFTSKDDDSPNVRPCCRNISSAVRSLSIAGDKMSINNRDDQLRKPKGNKECNCSKSKVNKENSNMLNLDESPRCVDRSPRNINKSIRKSSIDLFKDEKTRSSVSAFRDILHSSHRDSKLYKKDKKPISYLNVQSKIDSRGIKNTEGGSYLGKLKCLERKSKSESDFTDQAYFSSDFLMGNESEEFDFCRNNAASYELENNEDFDATSESFMEDVQSLDDRKSILLERIKDQLDNKTVASIESALTEPNWEEKLTDILQDRYSYYQSIIFHLKLCMDYIKQN